MPRPYDMKKLLHFNIALLLILSAGLCACAAKTNVVYKSDEPVNEFVDEFEFSGAQVGKAAAIDKKHHGKTTTQGEIYDMNRLVAAHGKLPFGTCVKVTNLKNNSFVVVRINNRMIPKKGRIIELSSKSAEQIGIAEKEVADVKLEVIKSQVGMASWYGPKYQDSPTASGEIFDMKGLTAAHRLFPFDTQLKVTNLDNGKSVVVRVNDRGPWLSDKVIDLSYEAARRLGMIGPGSVKVKVEVVL